MSLSRQATGKQEAKGRKPRASEAKTNKTTLTVFVYVGKAVVVGVPLSFFLLLSLVIVGS